MKKYTSVFFDLDNTLLDFKAAERSAVGKVLRRYSLPSSEKDIDFYSAVNKSYWERFERGEIAKSDIYESRFKTFLDAYNLSADISKIAAEYCEALSFEHQTISGAHNILQTLRQRGYKVYATTNGLATTQHKRVLESGLSDLFDGVFVSEDAHHQKPEREYFDYVISKIPEKDRKRILIIGDSQSSDVLGAINSRIDICWFNPEGATCKYKVDYMVSNLEQIADILK